MAEVFQKSLFGVVRSSEGFSIEILGRVGLKYKDNQGELRVDAEALSGRGTHVVVYAAHIPDTDERPRSTVLSNIERAFAAARWKLSIVGEE